MSSADLPRPRARPCSPGLHLGSNGPKSPVMHYLLFYEVVENYAERRKPFRADHLALAEACVTRGEMVLAGALADPIDGAVFLFQGASPSAAETFASQDPYVQ